MTARLIADILVIIHFIFIVFVVFGGFLVYKSRWVSILHIPSVLWAALLEIKGWLCPLTPLEHYFRQLSGGNDYTGGFIDHYLVAIIYPEGLTREMQITLGFIVLGINLVIYALVFLKRSPGKKSSTGAGDPE